MRAQPFLLAMAFALSTGTGCVSVQDGPTKTVVRQARPNPLNRQSLFRVSPPTFQGVKIGDKGEADYLYELSEGTQRSFLLDKDELLTGFSKALREDQGKLVVNSTSDRAHLVTVNIDFIEPGISAHRIEMLVHSTLRTFDPRGRLLDELELDVRVLLGPDTLTRGERMRRAGRQIGYSATTYLQERTGL